MAYTTYAEQQIGAFKEKSAGNTFEFSANDDQGDMAEWPHRVWVASGKIANDSGWRYAKVMKTVAYIVVDENDYGEPVVEKWYVKNHRTYQ